MKKNRNLTKAKTAKNDEFYTQLTDIEKEMKHYKDHFRGKVVYCNCDDPTVSAFFKYFSMNFEHLGLKKLIATCYKNDVATRRSKHGANRAVKLEYEGAALCNMPTVEDMGVAPLNGDGDFRSEECIELLKESDIVVTNPPFSLFREYVAQLIEHDKKFLIIGSINAITYKEIFPLIKEDKMWMGVNSNKTMEFTLPDHYERWNRVENGTKMGKVPGISWFTNLTHDKRNESLFLWKEYTPALYPKYDNYDAIEVSKTADIPENYEGVMGVPITFLTKYDPAQFEIVSSNDYRSNSLVPYKEHGLIKDKDGAINGKPTYARILIKHRAPKEEEE
jgi:hypothetical protein